MIPDTRTPNTTPFPRGYAYSIPRLVIALLCIVLVVDTSMAAGQDIAARDFMRFLASHRGKVIVVNFWATWCGPCIKEMPELARLRRLYPGGQVEIVGISLDYDPAEFTAYLARTPLPYPSFRDAGDVAETFGVTQIPRTFIINRAGRIHTDILGETTATALRRRIDPLLAP